MRDYALDGFELIQAEYVDSWLKLDDPADIQNLFQMTPYYYKTGRGGTRPTGTAGKPVYADLFRDLAVSGGGNGVGV